MQRGVALLAGAGLLLSACATVPDTHPLTGTRWQLVSIDAQGAETTLASQLQRRHLVTFADDETLELQLDCNRGRASWTAGQALGGTGPITIGPAMSTRMACPAPTFGQELAAGLARAQRYVTAPAAHELVLEGSGISLTLAAAE